MKNFKLLIKFMYGNKLIYLWAIVAINFSALLSTFIPVIIRVTIDSIIGMNPMDLPDWLNNYFDGIGGRTVVSKNLWISGILLVIMTLCQGIFLFLKGKYSAVAAENSGKRTREKVFDHLAHLPFDYHVKSKAGDLIQRCTSDVETIQNFLSVQFVEISQSIFSFTYILIFMFALDKSYSLVSIVLVPVILFFTFRFFNDMKVTFKAADEAEGAMSSTLQENLTGVRVVKAFGTQSFESEKFDEKSRSYRDLVYKIIYLMSDFWSISDFLCLTQYSLVLLIGIYWTSNGTTTLGTLTAFTAYAGMLIWPMRQLGQNLAFMGQAFVSLNRVQEILDEKAETPLISEHKPLIKGEIEFKNVSFGYNEDKQLLQDISFKIKKGQTVAFLGATGSGKSTIAHLLVRLYDYSRGSIKIDGIELKDIDRKWIRSQIGIVLQEPFLFSKTIRENIRLGKPDAHEHEIVQASSIASIHETFLEFEKGYETVIGERGVTLSGGQKQRLAIARSIIGVSPILIFDDSLSAVDTETDSAIRKALSEKNRGATTIIISHRIATLSEADVIFVLEGGKIEQAGTHEELINREGLYKRIWTIQNSLEEELAQII